MTMDEYTRANGLAGKHFRVDLVLTPFEANYVIDWLEHIDAEVDEDTDRVTHDHLVNYLYRICDLIRGLA